MLYGIQEALGMSDDRSSKPRVTLVSTRTTDIVPGLDGSHEIPGGPATYVGDALRRLDCPFTLITGETARVEVIQGPHGEDYLIPSIPTIRLPRSFTTEATILSPIMQEISARRVPPAHGILALDLQGFVRVPMTPFSSVRTFFSLEELLRKATLVKGSQDELDRLDDASRRALDHTLVLITRGAHGVTLRRGTDEYQIAATPLQVPNTIGAGDTFLAGMVVGLLRGIDPVESATYAMRFVESVLMERSH
ncbi:MAG: hypothetical protein NVS2B16_05340 [Chloroflexota bacterium]